MMKRYLTIARLSLAGAILAVSVVNVVASIAGFDASITRDIVAAFGGSVVTAGVLAKMVGLLA